MTIKQAKLSKAGGRFMLAVALIALGVFDGKAFAFDPQPDPPAFGLVAISPGQVARFNVVCWGHSIGTVEPGPCRAELMFHSTDGRTIKSLLVSLKPGQAASLDLPFPTTATPNRLEIIPCIVPGLRSGRLIPTVEIFDSETGRTVLFVPPVTPRVSLINGRPAVQ
jgi:hypothetical protein